MTDTKLWEDRIADIDRQLAENAAERKRVAHEATAELRAERKALLARKGKLQRAIKVAMDELAEDVEIEA